MDVFEFRDRLVSEYVAPSFRQVIEGTTVGSRGRSLNQPRHR
jgi:hypothetical protein